METPRRWPKGRRTFATELEQDDVDQVLSRELTIAELSRELAVEPSVIRRWQHLVDWGEQGDDGSERD